jgi:two-component system OmpR family sensor kinase
MKKKIYSQLWIYFSSIVFLTILVTIACLTGIIYLMTHSETWQPSHELPIYPLLIFAGFSMIVGTGTSIFVGHRILQPIVELRKNMREVADGDFSIQLDENQKIAEVQQLYADFNTMVQKLNSIELLRNDFVSNVSHEFKTPLATIQGYLQLLQKSDLSETERQVYLQRMLDGMIQLSQLTENTLKLNKLENQEGIFEKKVFRLDEQIREVLLFLQPKWEKEEIELDLDLEKIEFCGDEELLYQVWLNIMDNAIKYNRRNGKISVRLIQKNHRVLIEVTDTGIGMHPETMERIFDKFYQGDTSHKTKGNGLGLSLVKKIVELHEGKITYNSLLDVGTTVVIILKEANEK